MVRCHRFWNKTNNTKQNIKQKRKTYIKLLSNSYKVVVKTGDVWAKCVSEEDIYSAYLIFWAFVSFLHAFLQTGYVRHHKQTHTAIVYLCSPKKTFIRLCLAPPKCTLSIKFPVLRSDLVILSRGTLTPSSASLKYPVDICALICVMLGSAFVISVALLWEGRVVP